MTDAISVFDLGSIDYEVALRLQETVAGCRARDECGDLLLLLQHPPVITVGQGGGWEDVIAPPPLLQQAGVRVLPTDRGGRATYHGPGQLVAYPIFQVAKSDMHSFVWRLEEAVIGLLHTYALTAERLEEHPGVWVHDKKIAAIGLAVRENITRHGLALNVAPEMAHFDLLIPCGIPDRGVTSIERELGRRVDLQEVSTRFVQAFARVFERTIYRQETASLPGRATTSAPSNEMHSDSPQPSWLWRKVSAQSETMRETVAALLRGLDLHTVCEEADCPNIVECFGRGTATFLILGDICTRGCRFCAVGHGRPAALDLEEPQRVAEASARLGLGYVVITSVTRDDLPDGGSGQFAATVQAVRRRLPNASIEVLIPDLKGNRSALETVLAARPNVLNHNLETVPRLYPLVRPGADYHRSLALLSEAKRLSPEIAVKSGLMLGVGEHTAEVMQVLRDLRRAGCDLLTLGQYLQPSEQQLPVARYVPPDEFAWYEKKAIEMGFLGVAAGPLVRSSHQAETLWNSMQPVQLGH